MMRMQQVWRCDLETHLRMTSSSSGRPSGPRPAEMEGAVGGGRTEHSAVATARKENQILRTGVNELDLWILDIFTSWTLKLMKTINHSFITESKKPEIKTVIQSVTLVTKDGVIKKLMTSILTSTPLWESKWPSLCLDRIQINWVAEWKSVQRYSVIWGQNMM